MSAIGSTLIYFVCTDDIIPKSCWFPNIRLEPPNLAGGDNRGFSGADLFREIYNFLCIGVSHKEIWENHVNAMV